MHKKNLAILLTIFLAFFVLVWPFALAEVDWQAIEKKPSKLYDTKLLEAAFNEDAVRVVKIIDCNPTLMQKGPFKSYVLNKVDMLAQQNVSILNDNPNIKREWFLSYGIKDEGGTLREYDGRFVTLAFSSIEFDITEHKDSIVTYRDTLILPNKAEISSGLIEKDKRSGRIILVDGIIDITNSESIDLIVISDEDYSIIKNNEKKFFISSITESLKTFVIKTKENLTISGKDIEIFDRIIRDSEEEHRLNSELSGRLTFTKAGVILAGGTSYTTYFLGSKNIRYEVDAETFVFNKSEACKEIKESCIEADAMSGVIKIIAKDNKINVETFTLSPYKELYVEPINDDSEIIFTDKGFVKMTFSRKPFTVDGYLHKISVDVFYLYSYGGELREIRIKDGLLEYCPMCETRGAINTIDLTKIQTREIKLFDKVYSWAASAIDDPRYTSLGGAKGKIVYADRYKIYERDKTHNLESYKKLILEQKENSLKDRLESKRSAEERIIRLQEQLAQETDEIKKERILRDIKEDQDYLKYLEMGIAKLEQEIDSIKRIEYAYDCIGFVQGAFIEGEKAIQKSHYNWYKETDGFKLIQKLTARYKLNKVLVIFGSQFNDTHYIHGRTGEIAPIPSEIISTGTKILFFKTKKERNNFLRTIPPGSPFQNYNIDGTPHHSGIKGISENSLEAHIGDIGSLAEEDIQRYNDPLVFAFPEKKKITLDDLIRIAKK